VENLDGSAEEPSGVEGTACWEGKCANWGDPPPPGGKKKPEQRIDKPIAKRGAAERESEGDIVPLEAKGQQNPAEGKVPCFAEFRMEVRASECPTG
jgi:hypothetical protein